MCSNFSLKLIPISTFIYIYTFTHVHMYMGHNNIIEVVKFKTLKIKTYLQTYLIQKNSFKCLKGTNLNSICVPKCTEKLWKSFVVFELSSHETNNSQLCHLHNFLCGHFYGSSIAEETTLLNSQWSYFYCHYFLHNIQYLIQITHKQIDDVCTEQTLFFLLFFFCHKIVVN